jgi:uncharacterized small protein (DUF1192 family)
LVEVVGALQKLIEGEIEDPKSITIRPVSVLEVGKPTVVGIGDNPRNREKALGGKGVEIEQNLFRSCSELAPRIGSLTTEDSILKAFFNLRIVKVRTILDGNLLIGQVQVTQEFLKDRFLERPERFGHRLKVGLLDLKIAKDLRVLSVFEPKVRIAAPIAVMLVNMGPKGGTRGLHRSPLPGYNLGPTIQT